MTIAAFSELGPAIVFAIALNYKAQRNNVPLKHVVKCYKMRAKPLPRVAIQYDCKLRLQTSRVFLRTDWPRDHQVQI
jgi:hypothetical protein